MTKFNQYSNELSEKFDDLQNEITQLKSLLTLNEWTRSNQISLGEDAPQLTSRNQFSKLFDYSSMLLNLYSSYEDFINESARIWLKFISQQKIAIDYDKLATTYSYGVALILQKIDTSPRYANLNKKDLIKSLNDAIFDTRETVFFFEPFSADLNNLRLAELENLCARLQLTNIRNWFEEDIGLLKLCEESDHTVESRLKDFIERRNEVAHGRRTSEIYALGPLKDLGNFIVELCRSITEFLMSKMLFNWSHIEIGKISEKLQKADAYIFKTKTHAFSTGVDIYIAGKSRCKKAKILEIQVNGFCTDSLVPFYETEVGAKFSTEAFKKDRLFIMD
ncbi:hypothetical protein UNDYM_3370 [Undibacterium sp. YM2]|uniref:MAE_28990/MAE_18760 family HEPN-like nuclease n=1 Tax=Undibacterium sp. YM2 TaxID=2058625 RepID=UPI001331FB9D|nr:MAE_28990/MAE_18760 family HEPN-like nuclease [Undibacterium sp. YM2]BBB67623.1 hypothetical protein UNDYM_3370 [Undibacterium sp. YM2]